MTTIVHRLCISFCLMIVIFASFPSNIVAAEQTPRAEDGVLDLSDWSLNQQGVVPLDGQWTFYWEQLLAPEQFVAGEPAPEGGINIEVPKTWADQPNLQLSNQGYGTYKLTVKLHDGDLNESLAIALPNIATSYAFWVNGRLLEEHGVVGTDRASMVAQNYNQLVFITPQHDELVLVLQVSNFVQRKGGAWERLHIGPADQLLRERERRIMQQIAIAGGLFIMGAYHIGLYLFRRSYKPALFFGIACLFSCVRSLFVGDVLLVRAWPAFNWELAVKIEYSSAFATVAFFVLYAHCVFPKEINRKASLFFFGVLCVLCVPVALLPAIIYTRGMLISQLIAIIAIVYILIGVLAAAVRKQPGAHINFVFICLFLASIVNDTVFYNHWAHSRELLPFGLYLLVIGQTFVLAGRFSSAFAEVEGLTERLEETNRLLEHKVNERTKEIANSNERLQREERSRRNMLSVISHELGTPLTSLIGYLSAMKEGIFSPNNEKYMNVIYNKAMLLKRLTNDLQNLVRLESKRLHFQTELVPFHSFYDAVSDKYNVDVLEKGLQFVHKPLSAAVAKNIYLRVDVERLDQVLMNLVSNAIAHTPVNGTITISARVFTGLKKAVIEVSDTGAGISEADRPYIFERFYKGKHSLDKNMQGSGLGLSIAKEIVNRHNGAISIHGNPMGGSTFRIILPYITSEEIFLIQQGESE